MESLTLWITSDGIQPQYGRDINTGHLFKLMDIVAISAELDATEADQKGFRTLAPSESIRIRASSPGMNLGTQTFTAHAELGHITNTNDLMGTADSVPVTIALSKPRRKSR